MAKTIQAYLDNRGHLHKTHTSAVLGDITYALGRVGDEGGLTEGVARLILDKREEIEQAFADLDELRRADPVLIEDDEAGGVEVLNLEEHRKDQRKDSR